MNDVKSITVRIGDEGPQKTFSGRAAWALHNLIQAGLNGCTPIDHPGPRWSDYTFKIRRAGIQVDTITEAHGGAYKGTHARYVLRSPVEVLEIKAAGA